MFNTRIVFLIVFMVDEAQNLFLTLTFCNGNVDDENNYVCHALFESIQQFGFWFI